MSKIRFGVSNVCSCFTATAIGTRVLNPSVFLELLGEQVQNHDPSGDRTPGQHFIMLPAEMLALVSAGVGRRTDCEGDYVIRKHRGRVNAYLHREHAAQVDGCAAIVYTREAYLADPDIAEDPAEADRVRAAEATHMVVAVLAFAGPQAPLTPHRFLANLAGGNRDADTWSLEEIRAKAKEILEYDDEWCVVAD